LFSGAYEHTIDDKCRTVIPARIRNRLGESFVITRGLHGCLWIFPAARWSEVQQSLTPKSLLDVQSIKLERYFLGAATESETDRQGRFTIPLMLMDHANIKPGDSIWIVGLTEKVEIWGKTAWEEFNSAMGNELLEAANSQSAGFDIQ